jgi:hypothetical protein
MHLPTVVLPVPEGAERMNTIPLSFIAGFQALSCRTNFSWAGRMRKIGEVGKAGLFYIL